MMQLVVFRGLQGVFGGVLLVTVFTVLADIFPPHRLARVQGLFGAIFGVSAVFGPTVGGWITDTLGWRWVFYVNIPAGVLAVIVVVLYLPFVRPDARRGDIDTLGTVMIAAGLTPILIGLSLVGHRSWRSIEVMGPIGCGVVVMALFLWVERAQREPIMPPALWKDRIFAVTTLIGMLISFGTLGLSIFVPLIFQGVLGFSASTSGAFVTPLTLGVVASSVVTGQVMHRVPRYPLLGTAGALLTAVSLFMLAQTGPHTPVLQICAELLGVGLGTGVGIPLYITSLQSAVDPRYLGLVSSNSQFWRNVGGTAGTAIFGAVLAAELPRHIYELETRSYVSSTVRGLFTGQGNTQAMFNRAALAAHRAALPPHARPSFDQGLDLARLGLAQTLHELFLLAAAVTVVAALVSLLMPVVPLSSRQVEPEPRSPATADAQCAAW